MARVSTILCVADPGGSSSAVEGLVAATEQHDVDAIAVVGELSASGSAEGYRALFHALAMTGRAAYWVPGPGDAPLGTYVREAHAIEAAHPTLHGVHGTGALTPDGHVVVAGIGGEIDDNPGGEREEGERLRYPRLEAEYRLKVLDELGEHERMMLFWSRPAHRGLGVGGSETVAELVNTYRPRLVVCAGGRGTETLGKRSLVVAPGSLRDGHYAIVDLQSHDVELAQLAPARSA
jgi:Icc-related predicted phosphoesterase